MFSCETYEIFKNIYFDKHLRTTASKNQYVTEKTIYIFLSQNYVFIIITVTFEVLKFLLSFCAVIVFANLFYKNILSSLLCYLSSSELIDYHVKTFFSKLLTRKKILEQFTFTQKLSRKKFQIGRKIQLKFFQ